MNTDLRKKAENDLKKKIPLMNNAVFRKTTENVKKNRGVELVTTERRRNHVVSELKNHATKFSTEHL